MDDSLQFIIESPQTTQGQKKRPRLVTSCDNWCVESVTVGRHVPSHSGHCFSRLKKIKCLQPVPEAKCEACRTAKIACAFRDRERYFAERSRAIAGPQFDDGGRCVLRSYVKKVTLNAGVQARQLRLFTRWFSHFSAPALKTSTRRRWPSTLPFLFIRRVQPVRVCAFVLQHEIHDASSSSSPYQSPRHTPYSYNPNPVPSSFYRSASPPVPGALPLFDAEQQHPHPSLMQNFISVLFEQMASDFSFLTYADVMTDFMERRITPLLSNSLAAFATPYVTFQLANILHSSRALASQIHHHPRTRQSGAPQCCECLC